MEPTHIAKRYTNTPPNGNHDTPNLMHSMAQLVLSFSIIIKWISKKEVIGHYLDSKRIGIGKKSLFPSSGGFGILETPTIEEYVSILKKRQEKQKLKTSD